VKLSSKTNIIVGPPGTGKTTVLMGIIDELLENGTKPERICFLSFTRKAANEAKSRAADRFELSGERLTYFRTIHSLCFQQLGLARKDIMGFADYCEIAKAIGISITNRVASEDGIVSAMSKGDRLLFTENLARVNGITTKEQWERLANEDFYLEELEQVENTLIKYKQVNDKQDFTDMVNMFLQVKPIPDIDVLIVDEAQDLALNQWEVVKLLSAHVKETFVAGDDDQAIFRWAGADVNSFIELEGDVWTLDQSYRIPRAVKPIAEDIISRVHKRREKDWHTRDEQGSVEFYNSIHEVDMSQGTWLVLARNTYLLKEFNEHCTDNGYVFDSTSGSIIRGESLQAIRNWERLRAGKKITAADASQIYEFMSVRERVKYGFKKRLDEADKNEPLSIYDLRRDYGLLTDKIWHFALDRLSDEERIYFLTALKNGEKLTKEPRIKISTIHSVKGGEADNVIICTDMASRTWQEYQTNEDDEARVWYVAVTRAKKNLFILSPRTSRAYPI
jgi:DNA helicase-2/ATP-dependent DNA helicase PcrA